MWACLHGMVQPLINVLFDNGFPMIGMAGCNSSHCSENIHVAVDDTQSPFDKTTE